MEDYDRRYNNKLNLTNWSKYSKKIMHVAKKEDIDKVNDIINNLKVADAEYIG